MAWTVQYAPGFTGLTGITLAGTIESAGDVAPVSIGTLTEYTNQHGDYFAAVASGLTAGMNKFMLGGDLAGTLWGVVPASGTFRVFETRAEANSAAITSLATELGLIPTAEENAAAVLAAVGDGIELVSALSQDGGTLTFTQGDDLYTADGKAPVWTLTGTFPSWISATGELRLTSGGITKTITITDAQIQDTGSTRTITAEIPRATTGSLPEDPAGSFQVMVQLAGAGAHQFTEIKNGVLIVQRRIA